jgi:lipid-binding SYLF domain-containing protein
MTRSIVYGALLLGILSLSVVPARSAAQSEEADRVTESVTVFTEIMTAPDRAIPNAILGRADGVAVFPGTIKGGFIIGAQRGRGILSARNTQAGGWSAPAFMTLTGGSIGVQIGAQAVDIVLVVMNRRGLDSLVGNEFKIGADASVAAGPIGRDASAATDAQLRAEILSYSRARGLFAGVNLNGAAIRRDKDANQRFYGKPYETRDLLFGNITNSPGLVSDWRATLAKYAK